MIIANSMKYCYANYETFCLGGKMWNKINPLYAAAYFIALAISYATAYFTNPAMDLFHWKEPTFVADKRGFFSGADERTWTFTKLPPLEPESSASANSATSAFMSLFLHGETTEAEHYAWSAKLFLNSLVSISQMLWNCKSYFSFFENINILLTALILFDKMTL